MTDTNGTSYASAAAVAGLAHEVEALRRAVDPLRQLPGRVDELARLLARVADELADHTARSGPVAAPSWLLFPADRAETCTQLQELTAWMGQVYLRYGDAVVSFPDCWLWHPDVVEELLWLMRAWAAAYQGPNASVALVGDWHDRYRPGVVRRIKTLGGTCSLENHPTRSAASAVPLEQATELIATWWALDRERDAPEPTEEHHAEATRRMRGTRR